MLNLDRLVSHQQTKRKPKLLSFSWCSWELTSQTYHPQLVPHQDRYHHAQGPRQVLNLDRLVSHKPLQMFQESQPLEAGESRGYPDAVAARDDAAAAAGRAAVRATVDMCSSVRAAAWSRRSAAAVEELPPSSELAEEHLRERDLSDRPWLSDAESQPGGTRC